MRKCADIIFFFVTHKCKYKKNLDLQPAAGNTRSIFIYYNNPHYVVTVSRARFISLKVKFNDHIRVFISAPNADVSIAIFTVRDVTITVVLVPGSVLKFREVLSIGD